MAGVEGDRQARDAGEGGLAVELAILVDPSVCASKEFHVHTAGKMHAAGKMLQSLSISIRI